MDQGFHMEINRLPAKTFRWLKMNKTKYEAAFLSPLAWETAAAAEAKTAAMAEAKTAAAAETKTAAAAETKTAAAIETETAETGEEGHSREEGKLRESGIRGEIPATVTLLQEKDGRLITIPTGMGEDMDRLMEASGVVFRQFETQEGKKEEAPLRLYVTCQDKERKAAAIGLHIRENSELTVIMDYTSPKEGEGTAGIQTKILAEKGSRIRLIQLQRLGEAFVCFNDVGISCGEGAKAEVIQLVLGGKDTYQGCLAKLEGKDSSFSADVGYTAAGSGRLDMNYAALHKGKGTKSRMDCTGVLRDRAFKLFRGTIDFQRGAVGAIGNEKEDVLLLGEKAVNQTIPLILCGEEDVEGNHGATIGRLDEELLFYLSSRGMAQEEIYEMVARGRLDAVAAKIPDKTVREEVGRYLKERLWV